MDWQISLESTLAAKGHAMLRIDGQQWRVQQDNRGNIQFNSEYGRTETFDSFAQLTNAIYSWYEDPKIMVLNSH
ncbi:hypothetical protein LSG31_15280 [Fodinisporobacter ferrooxydans]|uniref:Uncharacterized protein n=1 Tax=Fodinisporobacter ferrooxydans TaxID=2901836 RepID=A0ABY4CFF1_9BACL|nr:hypothetical protein LSG31_15280 [Alicyclobacillaceae bacterium MYW30-H2]